MVMIMEKLFAAVRDMYPNAEVLDVRFQVDNDVSAVSTVSEIDAEFAEVIHRDQVVSMSAFA